MGKQKIASISSQLTLWLVVSVLVSSMLNSILYGYNTAVLNTPAKVMFQHFNQTFCDRDKCLESEGEWNFLPIATMIFVAGGMIGAFLSGFLANHLGRKDSLWYHEFVVLIGAVVSASSYWVPELLYVGRVFIGISCGISVCLVSTYLTEIAPREIRGVVGCFHQLGVVLGILLAQALGLPSAFGNSSLWWLLIGFPAIPAVISICVLKFCPESPRYLYMNKHNEKAARAALQKLRRTQEHVDGDLEEYKMEQETIGHGTKHISMLRLISRKEFRMALSLSCIIQMTQQLTGINAIFSFSSEIFSKSGVTPEQMPYAVLATGLVNLLVTLVSMVLMEKCGRRHLLIWPMCLMAASMLIIIFSIHFQSQVSWLSYVSIGCIMAFIMGFAPGLGPIAGLLPNELFRQEARSAAVSLALAVQWASSLLLTGIFNYLLDCLREFVFAGFLVLLVASIIYFYIFMPETKHKTFHEIQESLAFGRHKRKHGLLAQTADTDNSDKGAINGRLGLSQESRNETQLTIIRPDGADVEIDGNARLYLETESD